MNQGNKKSTKVLAIIIVALLVFVGIGVIVIGNMNANHIKKEEPVAEVSEVSSSSSSKKETSKSERDENTANTIEIKSDGGTESRVEEPAPRSEKKTRSTSSSDNDLYTDDGVLRYATTDPDMVAARRILLDKWAELNGGYGDNWKYVRMYEQTGGFGISAGGVGWGGIKDNGNNSYTFGRRTGPGQGEVMATETINF